VSFPARAEWFSRVNLLAVAEQKELRLQLRAIRRVVFLHVQNLQARTPLSCPGETSASPVSSQRVPGFCHRVCSQHDPGQCEKSLAQIRRLDKLRGGADLLRCEYRTAARNCYAAGFFIASITAFSSYPARR